MQAPKVKVKVKVKGDATHPAMKGLLKALPGVKNAQPDTDQESQ